MDFGDEDDTDELWNDEIDLEALEAEAKSAYAATQHRNDVPDSRLTINRSGESSLASQQNNTHLDILLAEKEDFERLARNKQGELLVLRSNIARTSNEHASVIDRLTKASNTSREGLEKQIEAYRDRIARLETDLVFQRQELKEARLRQVQSKDNLLQSPRKVKANGFIEKSAFQDDFDLQSPQAHSRKRRRALKNTTTDETGLDAFDLASRRDVSPSAAAVVDADNGPSQGIPPAIAPTNHKSNLTPLHEENRHYYVPELLKATDRPYTSYKVVQTSEIINTILQSHTQEQGNCVTFLSSVPMASPPSSFGSELLTLMDLNETPIDAQGFTLRLTAFLRDQIPNFASRLDVTEVLIFLLHRLLYFYTSQVAKLLALLPEQGKVNPLFHRLNNLLQDAQIGDSLKYKCLQLILQIVDSWEREDIEKSSVHSNMVVSTYRTIINHAKNITLRVKMLHILAGCVTQNGGAFQNASELLEISTKTFDVEEFCRTEQLRLRTVTLQYLWCIIVTQADGLQVVRKDRHVIPRLLRRMLNEVETLTESEDPRDTMRWITIAMKLYNVLLNEEAHAELEIHWRSTFFRSAHIVAMTRIAFAEAQEGYSEELRDSARDLLELALSPEEGDDIYEVMMGTTE